MAFVIYSEELGIYLGRWPGLASWSKFQRTLPASGYAIAFATIYDAMAAMMSCSRCPSDVQYIPVEPDNNWHGKQYASIAACVAAGLPAWNPNGSEERASA